jgi:pyruvate ferredoxin oxidoreductase gamma subunit
VLINSTQTLAELGIGDFLKSYPRDHLCALPATELAMKHVGRPAPNTALLGGFAAMTGRLRMESVIAAILDKFPGKVGEANAAAARVAYDMVRETLVPEALNA